MPTYGYHCQDCETEFEVLQRMSDPPEAACPTCGALGRRLFYPAGIVFRGSGFYKTDSRPSQSEGDKVAAKVPASTNGDGAAATTPAKTAGTGAAAETKAPAPPKPAATPSTPPSSPSAAPTD